MRFPRRPRTRRSQSRRACNIFPDRPLLVASGQMLALPSPGRSTSWLALLWPVRLPELGDQIGVATRFLRKWFDLANGIRPARFSMAAPAIETDSARAPPAPSAHGPF